MKVRRIIVPALGCVLLVCTLWAQRPFREYPAWEYNNFPVPADWNVPGEWTFARLMYPTTEVRVDWQSEYKRGFDWREGNTNWTIDYPRSDRHLAAAIRRLTRIQARSVEQPINLDADDDVFNYPWLYAVEVGHWQLTDSQIAKFREFLLRGGFFMCDDFHAINEWDIFVYTMNKVFPDRKIVDIPDKDAIFHTVFDLDDRYQVPGMQYVYSHKVYEKDILTGSPAHWRGIYDDKGRLMVVICHNMDLGDSWENADEPTYPQVFSALGIRIGVDYLVYSMTH
ncbi:MAG TPA: DUF4159 domain-containing protein [Candidatus Acidoferrales bacterium]|nr:DUF4159 domain-containing protein [Candidatus Acidoferrales bacterium]